MDLSTANKLHRDGRLAEAERAYRALLTAAPRDVNATFLLGLVFAQLGRSGEAVDRLRQAARLAPTSPQVLANLAGVLGSAGRHAEAADVLAAALRLRPDFAQGHENLGVALERLGRLEEAEAAHREAIRLSPNFAEAHCNLGNVLGKLGRHKQAMAEYRIAMSLGHVQAYRNLAATLGELGRAAEASACHRKLAELRPDDPAAGSEFLISLHHLDDVTPDRMFQEHVKWAERHAGPLYPAADRHAGRRGGPGSGAGGRLRIGYVSPDFREYPAAHFFLPVLESHDRGKFEVFCYSDVPRPDGMTGRVRALAENWREIAGLPDEGVDELIRRDRIDILVDLAGHMFNPRLLLFARKPAPVQATYIGYPNTTGLATMDYRITDAWHDLPNVADAYHTERLVRLPRCCWAYTPGEDLPVVAPLPADATGQITFGVMNRLVKVTPRMIELWARILAGVPGSRLLVLAPEGRKDDPEVSKLFAGRGIDPKRLHLVPRRQRREFLELFGQIDVALDTSPYAGMTTTCDALWMGVPTVTLAGPTHVSRTGVSIMHAVGLPELVAQTADQYVDVAVVLARDVSRLRESRAGMRERVRASDLSNGAGLAAAIETAFRQMWATRD